jgi:hypothetical protein
MMDMSTMPDLKNMKMWGVNTIYDAPAWAPPRSVQGKFEFEPFPDDLPEYHHTEYCDE